MAHLEGHLLLALVILLKLSSPLSSVTIGFEETRKTVFEDVGTVSLCASVMDRDPPPQYAVNISIAYTDRSAHGNLDYKETPHHFLFTPNQSIHCFNVTIIDDTNYEVREEFQVNLTTTDEGIMLSPKLVAIVLDDNDRVTVGWERASYTVNEGAGQLEVCARLTGYVEAVLQKSPVMAIEGTAINNKDFRFPSNRTSFPPGSRSGDKTCFSITLLKEIEYEEEKNFTIELGRNTAERLILDPQTTTIVITDYNAITQQSPNSECDGVRNLIEHSSMPDICSSDECDIMTCSTSNWSLALSLDGCHREITLNVTDYDEEEVSETFTSQAYEQELNHTYNNQTGVIRLTTRVVLNEQKLFYLLTIESLLFNLSFPTTAVPVECPQEGSTTPTSNSTTSNGLSLSVIIIISSSVGGAVAVLLVVAIILSVVCCILVSKRRKKKTITEKSYW